VAPGGKVFAGKFFLTGGGGKDMSPDEAVDILREAVTVILLMVAPILGLGLSVGLLVSVLQATTQVQEPTLAFVPKIIAVLVSVMLFSNWVVGLVVDFTQQLWVDGLGVL